MNPTAFALPARLAAKAAPELTAADDAHFAALAAALHDEVADASSRLDEMRTRPGGEGQAALERDLEVHRLTARLRMLRRFRLDLCLGRVVPADGSDPVYIGRFGLTDRSGRRLLVDWRAPAAEPFFAATHAHPAGLISRRRYRWSGGRIVDYWDEAFTADGLSSRAALDDQSAFIASLGASRSPQMRDVLSTIQSDQDAIIRASADGALVVDGGPGTGKTVVALHRTAYLLYADPRLAPGRGGVLFVGPHEPYLAYVADVLPSLGEDSVQTCTVRDLVAEGRAAAPETDPLVARLKSDRRLADVIAPAVARYEQPPTRECVLDTAWGEIVVGPDDWADAFAGAEPGATHNEARDEVWEEIVQLALAQLDDDAPEPLVRRMLARDDELAGTFARAWPLLDAARVVADLWTVPAFLRRCAPWLSADEVSALQRPDGAAWTSADLPLLDAARHLVGDPDEVRQRHRREAVRADERERRSAVIDDLIAADDSELLLMRMLRGDDVQNSLDDDAVLPAPDPDVLAGPFAHIVVDEAQELTDAEWGMLLRRCPSRSFTIVGDRAQARHGFTESWTERLERVGIRDPRIASLTINYRTPREVMAAAEPVIRAALPDANVPTSIRDAGPVRYGAAAERDALVDAWLAEHPEGVACVIGDPAFADRERVRALTPTLAKGLEFDLVVLVDPERFGGGIEGAVDRYVAMTRATSRLVVLTS